MRTIFLSLALLAATTLAAQHDNLYLIKGDRVVGQYAVDDVDYATFTLPDDVTNSSIWLNVDHVGKNTVTYSVGTNNPNVAYAHNILSYWDLRYWALNIVDCDFDMADEETRKLIIQNYMINAGGYIAMGNNTFTQTDYQQAGDGYSRFSVTPGTRHYVVVWEVDPATQAPGDEFLYQEITTLAPEESSASLDVTFKRQNEEGIAFNITGSDDIVYVNVVYGERAVMEWYVDMYGLDLTMGMFGQQFTLDFLSGFGDLRDDIENSTWPAYETGEYVIYVRGWDAEGNMKNAKCIASFENLNESEGPEIKVLSRDKGDGFVDLSFEITPSNVTEAYVRLMEENTVNDRLNAGYALYEIAMGGDATDITDDINRFGEYAFHADGIPEVWYSIIVYAKDKSGKRTAQRFNFNTFGPSQWSDSKPVHAPALRTLRAPSRIRSLKSPAMPR